MSGPYPYRDVTSRLFPLPARDWTENLDEPSYVECNLFRFVALYVYSGTYRDLLGYRKKHTSSLADLQEFS